MGVAADIAIVIFWGLLDLMEVCILVRHPWHTIFLGLDVSADRAFVIFWAFHNLVAICILVVLLTGMICIGLRQLRRTEKSLLILCMFFPNVWLLGLPLLLVVLLFFCWGGFYESSL